MEEVVEYSVFVIMVEEEEVVGGLNLCLVVEGVEASCLIEVVKVVEVNYLTLEVEEEEVNLIC